MKENNDLPPEGTLTNILCRLEDIDDGGSRGFLYEGTYLLAVRQDTHAFIYLNECPHLGVPLEWQEHQFLNTDRSLIQCSTHGALFTIDDGQCISGPCKGKHLAPIHHEVVNGNIIIKTSLK